MLKRFNKHPSFPTFYEGNPPTPVTHGDPSKPSQIHEVASFKTVADWFLYFQSRLEKLKDSEP